MAERLLSRFITSLPHRIEHRITDSSLLNVKSQSLNVSIWNLDVKVLRRQTLKHLAEVLVSVSRSEIRSDAELIKTEYLVHDSLHV